MKIKTIEAVLAYKQLKEIKVNKLNDETMLAIWKDIRVLRKVAEEYDKDVKEASNSLQDDEFKNMQKRLIEAQRRSAQSSDEEMTEDEKKDVIEINSYFEDFNKKGETYFKELADKELELELELVDSSEILKALKGADKTLESAIELEFIMK
jgi:hypothetical protein